MTGKIPKVDSLLVIIQFVGLISMTSGENHIRFDTQDGGYSSILISINKDVTENHHIVQKLKVRVIAI